RLRFLARHLIVDGDRLVIGEITHETQPGYRNFALANFMRAYRNLDHPVDHVLGVYFHQCALSMSCEQLARAGLFLA
ncbi:glutaminase, partial [Rhizobium leguminosarum]|uniref:glutaminase n=1 Tax=Rhizobium leguminosarum TaxID=384 RepID=UPI003F9B79F5